MRAARPILAWLLLALPCSLAQAEDGAPHPERNLESLEALLEESVVTTASRSQERTSSAPATVFSITAAEIRAFGIRSIDEALAYLGVGIHVQKTRDYSAGVDVGAQGIMLRDYGRHLLVLLDGHVMNSQTSGQVPLHEALGVPLEAIDHIEVMLGAGSVMYGSNAMTAVVHVVTKSAEADRGQHVITELSMAPPSASDGYARLPGGERELGLHYRIGVGVAHTHQRGRTPLNVALRAEWQEDRSQSYEVAPAPGDLRPGETAWGGVASHTMRVPSTVATLRAGNLRLRVQGSRYERGIPLAGLFADERARETRGSARLDLSHSALLHPTLRLNSRLYADYTSTSERTNWTSPIWCLPGQIDGCRFRSHDVSRWIGAEQLLSFEPRADGSLSTIFGYDVRLRDASGRPAEYRDLVDNSYPIGMRLPYFHEQTVLGALFVQQLYSPLEWLTLNAGGRLDIDSVFGTRLSPRAAVVLRPTPTTSIRVSYAEAFRGPTSLEMNLGDATYVIPPGSLGPEVVRTAELELTQRIGWATAALRGYAAFYDGLIDARPATEQEVLRAIARGQLSSTADPAWIITNDNLNPVDSYGGSLTLQLRPTRALTVAASATLSRSTSPEQTLTLWPVAFGNMRVLYEFWRDGPTLGFASVFAIKRRPFSDYDDDRSLLVDAYARQQLDMRLTLASPIRALPGLRIRAGLGARVQPDLPYLVTHPSPATPDVPTQYAHDLPQLHLLLGVSYDH